jgi:hypothetical protein
MANAPWPRVGSIHAVAIRLTRLAQTGAPIVGAKNAFVSHSLVKLSFAPVYTEGQKIEEKNGADGVCVTFQGSRKLSGGTVKLEVCSPDPELEEILAGNTLFVDGTGNAVGGAWPAIGADPTPNGVSVEMWTHAIDAGSLYAGFPYIRWVLGRAKFSPDEQAAENAAMKPAYSGTLEQNPNWGNGAFNDWDQASTKLVQYALDTEAHFPATPGYITVPVQS